MARRVQEVRHGWIELASAIVLSAIKENDDKFLQSEWGKYLKELVLFFAKDNNNGDVYPVHI